MSRDFCQPETSISSAAWIIKSKSADLGSNWVKLGPFWKNFPKSIQAVVVAREEKAADTRLVAYIVLSNGLSADSASLRSYLRDKLPVFMVPAQFVFIDSLPLTANGKIDRMLCRRIARNRNFDAGRGGANNRIGSCPD